MEVGRISAIFRYPIKSMGGESTEVARLGWHGLEGDRRFAFRRIDEPGGFPWLTASRLPGLILYRPFGRDEKSPEPLPTHVRTPEGVDLELRGDALREDIARRYGAPVELMRLNHGMFDEAPVSIISLATLQRIERETGRSLDVRRFRPNIVVETNGNEACEEDGWVGNTLTFGAVGSGAAVSVTMRDLRCMMINLDPETGRQDPEVMKAVIRMNENNAGVYATVVKAGELHIGQTVSLQTT
jgi:hypothetical protein